MFELRNSNSKASAIPSPSGPLKFPSLWTDIGLGVAMGHTRSRSKVLDSLTSLRTSKKNLKHHSKTKVSFWELAILFSSYSNYEHERARILDPPNKKVYPHLQLHRGMRVDERDWKLQTEAQQLRYELHINICWQTKLYTFLVLHMNKIENKKNYRFHVNIYHPIDFHFHKDKWPIS